MLKKKITIGLISLEDPNDRNISSGTNYKIAEVLKNIGGEIKWLHPYHSVVWIIMEKVLRRIYNLFSQKTFMFRHTRLGAYLESHTIKKEELNKCDIIFASFSSPSCYKLDFPTQKPVIYLSDAVWHSMVGYYFKDIDSFSTKDGDIIERFILNRANKIISTSNWMTQNIKKHYNIPQGKIVNILFGANIDDKDITIKNYKSTETLDILFVGVDWERKGGRIAIEAVTWLNNNGIKSTLHIIGGKNIDYNSLRNKHVNYIGMLNKNIPSEYQKITEMMAICHLMLLPTQAECTGISICESNAFGLPVYSTQTGGVSSYIIDGENGRLLPEKSTGIEYGLKIKEDIESKKLKELITLSRKRFLTDLNWHTFSEKISVVLNSYI